MTLAEARRRNETERFLRIETDNNAQLRTRIDHMRRELSTATKDLSDAEQLCSVTQSDVRHVTTTPVLHYYYYYYCYKESWRRRTTVHWYALRSITI